MNRGDCSTAIGEFNTFKYKQGADTLGYDYNIENTAYKKYCPIDKPCCMAFSEDLTNPIDDCGNEIGNCQQNPCSSASQISVESGDIDCKPNALEKTCCGPKLP